MKLTKMSLEDKINSYEIRKRAFITIIIAASVLLIISLSTAVNAGGGVVTLTQGGNSGNRNLIRLSFEIWNFSTFIFSGAILILLPPINFISKTMILSAGKKVNLWRKYGEVRFSSFFRKASVITLRGTITIVKQSNNYLITLPLLKSDSITNFGFIKDEGNYKIVAKREEIASILHLYHLYN